MKTEEFLHILISVVTIALAFSIYDLNNFFPMLIIIGTGFVCHELAHKYTALKYGLKAEYRAWTWGLVLAVALAIVTQGQFVFAAPGAVYHASGTRQQNGKIAWAGPMTNLTVAVIFYAIGLLVPPLYPFAVTGAAVNAFLGMFNMIPIFPFDGEKIAKWSQATWALTFLALMATWVFLTFTRIQ